MVAINEVARVLVSQTTTDGPLAPGIVLGSLGSIMDGRFVGGARAFGGPPGPRGCVVEKGCEFRYGS